MSVSDAELMGYAGYWDGYNVYDLDYLPKEYSDSYRKGYVRARIEDKGR